MITLFKKEKSALIFSILAVVFLIALDQVVKQFIFRFYGNAMNRCNEEGTLVHFHPVFNKAGSTLHMNTGIPFDRPIFLAVCILCIVFSILCLLYLLYIKSTVGFGMVYIIPSIFLFAGTAGRLVDRIFWTYTLDFISIKNVGIIDFVDIYLAISIVGLLINYITLNKHDRKSTKEYTKAEKKAYKKARTQGFRKLFKIDL